MSAFVESITIAYGQHEARHPVAERFFALGLYLLALFAGIIMLPLLAIGPDYLPRLFPESWRGEVSDIVNLAYYPAIALGLIFMLTVLYKVAPKHKHPWYRGVPGALLAAAVFIVASFGLRLYLSYVYAHGLTYGALATPITFLLFYYFVVDGDHHRRPVQQRDAGVLPAARPRSGSCASGSATTRSADQPARPNDRRPPTGTPLTERAGGGQPFFIDS